MASSLGAGDERLRRLRQLVDSEPSDPHDRAGLAGHLNQICRAAARSLPASGAGVTIMDREDRPSTTIASSGPRFRDLEDLQSVMGEGPCIDAYLSRGPVLVPSLAAVGMGRWPAYTMAALEQGVGAVFAFPLQVGAARLGVLDVYRDQPAALSPLALADALGFASVCLGAVLGSGVLPDGRLGDDVSDALGGIPEVYQAQGAVMIQLGLPLADAMARLRARAYASSRPVEDVARDVLAGSIVFTREDS